MRPSRKSPGGINPGGGLRAIYRIYGRQKIQRSREYLAASTGGKTTVAVKTIPSLTVALVLGVSHAGAVSGGAAEPVPTAVPSNASRVTADVLGHKIWSPETLQNAHPSLASQQRLWSLRLAVVSSAPADHGLAHLLEAGTTVEAFSDEEIAQHLVGQRVAATLTLTGDTRGSRWMITTLSPIPRS